MNYKKFLIILTTLCITAKIIPSNKLITRTPRLLHHGPIYRRQGSLFQTNNKLSEIVFEEEMKKFTKLPLEKQKESFYKADWRLQNKIINSKEFGLPIKNDFIRQYNQIKTYDEYKDFVRDPNNFHYDIIYGNIKDRIKSIPEAVFKDVVQKYNQLTLFEERMKFIENLIFDVQWKFINSKYGEEFTKEAFNKYNKLATTTEKENFLNYIEENISLTVKENIRGPAYRKKMDERIEKEFSLYAKIVSVILGLLTLDVWNKTKKKNEKEKTEQIKQKIFSGQYN